MRDGFRIVLLPGKQTRHRIEAELEQRELAAIGYVITQWAFLEHLILTSTVELCPDAKFIPAKASSLAFNDRLRAWRQTIEKFATTEDKGRLLKLVGKAANLEEKRHKISHGLWTSDASDPATLIAYSYRPRVAFEVEFDFDGLIKLAHEVGELCFNLVFPEGKQQAFESMATRGGSGFVSRSFALDVIDKNAISRNKRPRVGNRPKRKSQNS
jgi:hypothetical protein